MLRDIAPSDEASIKAYEELYGPGSYEPWTDEIHESQLREHARVLDSIGRKLETSALAASLRSHKHAADVGWAFEFVAHLAGPAIELMRLDPSLSASESTDRVLAGWRLPAGIPPELVLGQYDWRLVELVREELDRMGIAERLEGRVRLRALAFDVVCRFFDLKAPAVRRYLRQHQVGVSTTKCIKQLLPVRG